MTPLPDNPRILIQIDDKGSVQAIASNIAPEVEVRAAYSSSTFEAFKKGLPFVQTAENNKVS